MSLAKLYSRALSGLIAAEIIVEVHVAAGLPAFAIVGLPDTQVRESRERVRAAIQMTGYAFPARRITVNLAPADLPKESSRYDLPIALGILLASGLIKSSYDLAQFEFAGELALDGALRALNGALAIAYGSLQGQRKFILPQASAAEAALVTGAKVLGANSLQQVIEFIQGNCQLAAGKPLEATLSLSPVTELDLADVKGQVAAKTALEIAAAGRHSMLLIGNPGSGKTMLAQRISSILPALDNAQAMVSAALHSLTNSGFKLQEWGNAPFRSPHHSISARALIGGGANPQPGEISLAHNGVLFLDELPEFERRVLEMLREPLESKRIQISRVRHKVEYLADFQLIAAMNPCPCGDLGHPRKNCSCSVEQINRYRAKISGPLLDRIDVVIEVPCLMNHELQEVKPSESSAVIKLRVAQARNYQLTRQGKLNSELSNSEIEKLALLDNTSKQLLAQIVEQYGLSARNYYRLLKLARSAADLEQQKQISTRHLALASHYKRNL